MEGSDRNPTSGTVPKVSLMDLGNLWKICLDVKSKVILLGLDSCYCVLPFCYLTCENKHFRKKKICLHVCGWSNQETEGNVFIRKAGDHIPQYNTVTAKKMMYFGSRFNSGTSKIRYTSIAHSPSTSDIRGRKTENRVIFGHNSLRLRVLDNQAISVKDLSL